MIDFLNPSMQEKIKTPDSIRMGTGKPEPQSRGNEIHQSTRMGFTDENGNLLIKPIESLVQEPTISKESAKKLQQHLDSLESLEVIDALSTVDSPWNEVVGQIANNESLIQAIADKEKRNAYVDKLLIPLGADLFRIIRQMTSDPLQRETMFHCIAEDLCNNPAFIKSYERNMPKPEGNTPVGNSLKRAFIESSGQPLSKDVPQTQIDAYYSQALHMQALRSRLLTEQPLFTIKQYEKELDKQEKELKTTVIPFVRENLNQSIRETKNKLQDMTKIRHTVDRLLPTITNESFLLGALDDVQQTRFDGVIGDDIPPHRFEQWVPINIRESAEAQMKEMSTPRDDLTAMAFRGLSMLEQSIKKDTSKNKDTWGNTQYKKHMEYLKDPLAQAKRKQIIMNIIDLAMTVTTIASGATGSIQRQIEGPGPTQNIQALIDTINSQQPWEIAADLATPKPLNPGIG